MNKPSMSPFDEKRFILEGSINNLPYCHADAFEATDLESDSEWDASMQDEIGGKNGKLIMSWTARSLHPLKDGSHPIPSLKVGSHLSPDSTK